jgi:hypothetical protein
MMHPVTELRDATRTHHRALEAVCLAYQQTLGFPSVERDIHGLVRNGHPFTRARVTVLRFKKARLLAFARSDRIEGQLLMLCPTA